MNRRATLGDSYGMIPALRRAEQHEEPLVREHAAWAIRQIEKRTDSK